MAGQVFLKFVVLVALWVAVVIASKKNSSFFEELISGAKEAPLSSGELRLLKGSILYYLLFFGFLFSFALLNWTLLFYGMLLLIAIDGAILVYACRHIAADFLSGIAAACAGEPKVGDFLHLESEGETGRVEKVSLLGVRLATGDGCFLSVPFSTLARSSYAVLPSEMEKEITIVIDIKDPEEARTAMDVIRRVGQDYHGRDADKAVRVNLEKTEEEGATLALSLGIRDQDYQLAQSELQLELISAFKSQNIRFASIEAD